MGSHVYEFTGKFFLQLLGGPIGLNVTAWAASIVMKCLDNIWTALLRSNNVDLLAYLRYVDDSRSFTKGFKKGVRWSNGNLNIILTGKLRILSKILTTISATKISC